MEISLEISMYPLHKDYKKPILAFIEKLKTFDGLTVVPNTMSTQIFGEFETVMDAYKTATKEVFEEQESVVMATKFINMNLIK